MGSFYYPFFKNSVKVTYTSRGVTEITFANKKVSQASPQSNYEKQLAKSLEVFLSGHKSKLDIDIDWKNLQGTDFQKKVWRKMYKIPYGRVKTYGELAKSLNTPKASRAVGSACGKNPVLLAIPCHRVVGVNGLGGFSGGGLAVKRQLHNLEGINL